MRSRRRSFHSLSRRERREVLPDAGYWYHSPLEGESKKRPRFFGGGSAMPGHPAQEEEINHDPFARGHPMTIVETSFGRGARPVRSRRPTPSAASHLPGPPWATCVGGHPRRPNPGPACATRWSSGPAPSNRRCPAPWVNSSASPPTKPARIASTSTSGRRRPTPPGAR